MANMPEQQGVGQYGWLWGYVFLVEPSFTGLCVPQGLCSLQTFKFTHMSLLVQWSQNIKIWGVFGNRVLDIIYKPLN